MHSSSPGFASSALLGVALLATSASAQDAPPASPTPAPPAAPVIELAPEPERAWTFELRGGGSHTFAADIDDSPGDVSISRAAFGFTFAFPIGERSRFSIGVDEEVSWYVFDGATGLVPGSTDPFELTLQTDVNARFFSTIDDRWSWFVGGLVSFAGEPDADVGDSATFGGFVGARYTFSDQFSLSFGVGARSRLEDDALFIPLLGIEWKISDRVTLSSEGATLRLTARLSEQFGVSFSGGWELREFRLRDDGPLPDGVVRDSRAPIGVSLDWKPGDNIQVSFFGGVVVWQEFRFDDRDGDEISETNTDPAPFVGISAKFTF